MARLRYSVPLPGPFSISGGVGGRGRRSRRSAGDPVGGLIVLGVLVGLGILITFWYAVIPLLVLVGAVYGYRHLSRELQRREDQRASETKAREIAQQQWIAEFETNPMAEVELALRQCESGRNP